MISLQVLLRQLSLQICLESRFKGFFDLFPDFEKIATISPRPGLQLGADFTSSTPRAHDDDFYIEDEERVWMKMDTGQWKLLGTNVVVGQPWP